MIIFYIIIVAIVIGIIWQLLPVKGLKQISATDLKQKQVKGIQLIDVRTPGEFNAHHAKGFTNIPLQQLNKRAHTALTKEKSVIVICQSGMRSKKAGKILLKSGFTDVTNVKGGMNAYKG